MLTDFQSGLLSAAIGAFSWAASSFNCGFFNYIFTVTVNSTIALRQADILSSIRTAVSQNLFQGGSRNLEVYQWLPSELKDGNGASYNVAILTGVMIFICLLLVILPVTVIVISSSCCCCFKTQAKTTKLTPSHERGKYHEAYFLGKTHAQTLETIKSSDRNAERFNLCHIAMFAATFVFIAALIISIATLFVASGMVTNILAEDASASRSTTFEPDNFNIHAGVQYIFSRVLDFLDTGINKGRVATDAFLADVNSTFMNLLEMKVSTAVDELLVEYGVQLLMQTGETLQKDLNALQANMEYIRLTNQQVSSDISQLVGKFKVIHELVVPELNNVCAVLMGTEIAALCDSLKSRASMLLLQFNASAINVDPPAVLNFIITELGVDLNQILGQFGQFTSKILEVKDQVLSRVSSFLDFSSLFASMVQIWDTLSNAAASINEITVEIKQAISRGLSSVRNIIYALIYTPLTILLGFLVAHSVITILYICEAKKTKLLFSSSNDSYDSTRICSNIGNLVHAVIFSIFLITECIIITALLPTCIVISSDSCIYLVEQQGVVQADHVLNSYVANEIWPKVLDQIEKYPGGPVKDFLFLSSPRNVINVSTVVCRQSTRETKHMGFLGALGWNTFISIKNIFSSSEVQKEMEEGEKLIKTEILNLNLASLIPSDLDQIIKTTQNLTLYFDNIDYQTSIDELSPSKQPTAELSSYADDLESLILKIENLGLPPSDILKQCVNLIRKDVVTLTQVDAEASKLRDAFIGVQNRRNLTAGIEDLVKGIEETKKAFSNQETILAPVAPIYWRLMDSFKVALETDLNPVIQSFVHDLFPCHQIYMATDALLTMICRKSGGLSRLFTWLYVLAIAMAISTLLFFSIFQLGVIQTNHFRLLQLTPKVPSAPINEPNDRYVLFPRTGKHVTPPSSNTFHTQIQPPNVLGQQQQQNYRLAAPVPAICAYADLRDFNLLRVDRSAEVSETQDIAYDIAEGPFYEVLSYQPIPAPRSGNHCPISESEPKDEMLNHEQLQQSSPQQHGNHDI